MTQEKRKSKRAPYALLASVRLEDRVWMLPAHDLSVGGVRLSYAGDELKPGQDVDLDFELPDSDRTIAVRGRIARATADEIGVEFGALKIPVRKAIEKYVAETLY